MAVSSCGVPKRLRAPDPLAIKPAVQHLQSYVSALDDLKVVHSDADEIRATLEGGAEPDLRIDRARGQDPMGQPRLGQRMLTL
jgi:hypothetical protein